VEKFFMTQEGFDELQKKLNYLKTVRRLEASERIKQAREYGDLSENAEYDAAKDEQAMIEADIRKIEAQLENAEIIADGGGSKNVVVLGSKVTLLDVDMNEEEEWLIATSLLLLRLYSASARAMSSRCARRRLLTTLR